MSQKKKVFVVGVGMTKFEKPGARPNFDYPEMSCEAVTKALEDSGLSYKDIEQACVGYCYGDSTCGQRALYQIGMTGIPIYNVNNNCSTGSTALMLARQLIEGGISNCVMALGFEKMERGSLGTKYSDRTNPMDKHIQIMSESFEIAAAPITSQMFGNAGIEHMRKYGTKPEHFAKIAQKNHQHSSNNPNSQFQTIYTLDEILKSGNVYDFLTKLQCCPTSDGSACAILASEEFVRSHNLESKAVEILAQSMATDLPSTFLDKDCIKLVGYDMTRKAADQVYKDSGLGPDKIDVVELHDCFSANELITYEALRLCPEGKAGEFVDRGDNTYGGKYVINPSGGLISKGHPLGATGVAQCAELCWQLRGDAGKRQVKDARVALQHNVGLGGAVVITMYAHGFPDKNSKKNFTTITKSPTIKMSGDAKKPTGPVSTGGKQEIKLGDECDFFSKTIFEKIAEALKEDGESYVKKINGIFCFKIRKDGKEGTWIVDVKNDKGSVKFDPKGMGDVTLTLDDKEMLDLVTGKLNAQQAFFQGKLKLHGNMGLAMKLQSLLKPSDLKSKL